MIPVAILAGGLATRLRSVAPNVPKVLVPVAGKPFIDHQLALLKRNGCSRVVLCVGHLGELVRDHVGDGRKWGLQVDYSFDGERLLGTGGALFRALPKVGNAFFVLYGDSYLRCNFHDVEQAFEGSGKPALMTVLRNENKWDTSNVQFSDGVVVRYDKKHRTDQMQYIDYGLSTLRESVFDGYGPDEPFDLSDLFSALARKGQMGGYEVRERFYEIGSPAGLAETSEYLSNQLLIK